MNRSSILKKLFGASLNRQLTFALGAIMMLASVHVSATTYYSQSGGSLNLNTLANWNSVRVGGGAGTQPASAAAFTTAGNIFVIQGTGNGGTSPHAVTSNTAWTVGAASPGCKLQIENGATLTSTAAITITGGATNIFQVDNGGTYVHNNTVASPSTGIFGGTESFGATSTVRIDNWASNTTVITTGVTLPFGILELNWTANTAAWQQQWSGAINLTAGNFKITSVGTGNIRFTASTNYTLTIGGNYIQNNTGNVIASQTTGIATVNVGGNFTINSGNFIGSNGGGDATIGITGNYSQTGGALALGNGAGNAVMNVGGTCSLTGGVMNIVNSGAGSGTFTVTGNTTLNVTGTDGVYLQAAGTGTGIFQTQDLIIPATSTSTQIIDFGAGTIPNNEFRIKGNFSKAASSGSFYTTSLTAAKGFVFNGTGTLASPQTLSYAGTNSDYINYVVNSGTAVKFLTDLTLSNLTSPVSAFTVNTGGTLDCSTFKLICSGANASFTLATGATLATANTNGVLSGTAASISNNLTTSFNTAANYIYNGTSLQTANMKTATPTMNNLTINNSAGVVLVKPMVVNGALTLTSGNVDMGAFNISLAAASTITGNPGFSNSNMLVATGAGGVVKTVTANGSFTFPIGDNTGTAEYSPVTVAYSGSAYASAFVAASLSNAKHTSNNSTTFYLNRYWNVLQSGITGCTATITGTYLAADVITAGNDASISSAQLKGTFNQATNPWIKYSTLGGNTLTATSASLTAAQVNVFTGVTGAAPTVTSTNGTVCTTGNTTTTLTATPGAGTDVTPAPLYQWSPSGGTAATTTAIGAGTYTVTMTDANGITATNTGTITATTAPTAYAGGNNSVCAGLSYSLVTASATNYTSVSWSNNGGDGTFDDNTLLTPTYTPGATDIANGSVTLTLTSVGNSPCANAVNNMTLTIIPAPVSNAGSNTTICSTPAYSLSSASALHYSSVSWGNNGGDGTFSNAGIVNPTYTPGANDILNGTVTLTLTANGNGSCNSVNSNIILTINAAPTPSAAGTDQSLCSSTTASLSANTPTTGTGAWTVIAGGAAVTTPGSETSGVTGLTTGTNTFRWTISNGVCPFSADDVSIIVHTSSPAQPSAVSGAPSDVCPPAAGINLSVTNDPDADYYTWVMGPGTNGVTFNPVSTTNAQTIDLATTTNSTYGIRVTATNACGTSTHRSVSIRRAVSTPAAVTGPTTVCASGTYGYSTGAVTGATSYIWSGPAGTLFDGTNPTPYTTVSNSVTATLDAGFTSGTIGVAAQVACFTSTVKTLAISSTAPAISVISGSTLVCPNTMYTYSVTSNGAVATYNWTLPVGASGSSSTNSINVTYGATVVASNISVTGTSVCGATTAPRTMTTYSGTPARPASITGPSNGLCGQTVAYSCPVVAGATTYTWTSNAGATINSGQGTNGINISFPTFTNSPAKTVCVTAGSSCGTSASRCITINGAPNTPSGITANPTSWCANTNGIVFTANLTGVTGSYTLNWTYPGATVATYAAGGGNNPSLTLDWVTGSGNVAVTAANACGNGTRTVNFASTCREGFDMDNTANTMSVYPNPANSVFNVEFTAEQNANCTVQLVDITGKVVYEQKTTTTEGINKMQVDVKHLAKGLYLLNVSTNVSVYKTRVEVN